MPDKNPINQFDDIDERVQALEDKCDDFNLDEMVTKASVLCAELMLLYASANEKELPKSEDLLVLFKAFVKGDSSLTAVRDNIRELVYYRNCIIENRYDALPENPKKMTIHTIRHIYLYLRSRADQEGALD